MSKRLLYLRHHRRLGSGEERCNAIIRSFKMCGISVAVDGSEDDQINIKGLTDRKDGYAIGNKDLNDMAVEAIDEIHEEDTYDVDESMPGSSWITEEGTIVVVMLPYS